MRFSVLPAFLAIVFSGAVLSAETLQLDVAKTNFEEQQKTILSAVNSDVDYSEISVKDRTAVTDALARIAGKLSQGPYTALTEEIRQEVLQDQVAINAKLEQAKKDSRLICKREAKTGTNFSKKVCRTAISIRLEEQQTRANLPAANTDN